LAWRSYFFASVLALSGGIAAFQWLAARDAVENLALAGDPLTGASRIA
jgi:hypothetical protein